MIYFEFIKFISLPNFENHNKIFPKKTFILGAWVCSLHLYSRLVWEGTNKSYFRKNKRRLFCWKKIRRQIEILFSTKIRERLFSRAILSLKSRLRYPIHLSAFQICISGLILGDIKKRKKRAFPRSEIFNPEIMNYKCDFNF